MWTMWLLFQTKSFRRTSARFISSLIRKDLKQTINMAQRVKMLTTKTKDLISIPGRKNMAHSLTRTYTDTYMHAYIHETKRF